MASSEPCYSWNIFASWQLGDRPRFLEGMYSLFAGAYSRQTYSVCETRGGITGCTHWLPSVLLARLAVIDDQVADGELHLLRLMPLAWQQGKPATFERMPTEFGPVTLRVEPAGGGKELSVVFVPQFKTAPSRVVLHVPPLRGLEGIRLNGRALAWDGRARQLDALTGLKPVWEQGNLAVLNLVGLEDPTGLTRSHSDGADIRLTGIRKCAPG
jgi:hypothetical protein